jgi:membrane associated rhomboid family serine protease
MIERLLQKYFPFLDARACRLMALAVFFIALSSVYITLFSMPAAKNALALDPTRFFSGEEWRLLTYQFVHNNLSHLVENTIAFFISILLAFELSSSVTTYSTTYLSSGIFAILPLWFVVPFFALGASTAIYGTFGLLCLSAGRFRISPFFLLAGVILLTLISVIYSYHASAEANAVVFAEQFVAHISGLLFGFFFGVALLKLGDISDQKRMRCLESLT